MWAVTLQESHHSAKSRMQPSQGIPKANIRSHWSSVRIAINKTEPAIRFANGCISRQRGFGP
jgi:hypothetical protein